MTVPDRSTPFTPASTSDWTEGLVNLSPFKGSEHVLIKFEVTTAGGNNLFIDDINVIDLSLGINESTDESITIYPNPANDLINIHMGRMIDKVEIRNQVGKLVYDGTAKSSQLSINLKDSQIAKGLYYISVFSEQEVYYTKLIVN